MPVLRDVAFMATAFCLWLGLVASGAYLVLSLAMGPDDEGPDIVAKEAWAPATLVPAPGLPARTVESPPPALPSSSGEADSEAPSWAPDATHDLMLTAVGRNRISVIRAVRKTTGLPLKPAQALVASGPCVVARSLTTAEGESMLAVFSSTGASVTLAPTPVPPRKGSIALRLLSGPKRGPALAKAATVMAVPPSQMKAWLKQRPVEMLRDLDGRQAGKLVQRLKAAGFRAEAVVVAPEL